MQTLARRFAKESVELEVRFVKMRNIVRMRLKPAAPTEQRLAANGLTAWDEVQRRGYEGLVAKDAKAYPRRRR